MPGYLHFKDPAAMSDQICVKITVYNGTHADKVVYYRNKLPMAIIEKWKWYFEYLAARIKVRHPRRRVDLVICSQTLLQGEEFVQERIKNLLKHRRSRLQKLINTPVTSDLFSSNQMELDKKIEQARAEIEALERGEYNGYVPPVYINDIKQWI